MSSEGGSFTLAVSGSAATAVFSGPKCSQILIVNTDPVNGAVMNIASVGVETVPPSTGCVFTSTSANITAVTGNSSSASATVAINFTVLAR